MQAVRGYMFICVIRAAVFVCSVACSVALQAEGEVSEGGAKGRREIQGSRGARAQRECVGFMGPNADVYI